MTQSEAEERIETLETHVGNLINRTLDLEEKVSFAQGLVGAMVPAAGLMFFTFAWFGGCTVVEAPRNYPANVGELVETLEKIDPKTSLGKEKRQ